jgi:hypothetical protein
MRKSPEDGTMYDPGPNAAGIATVPETSAAAPAPAADGKATMPVFTGPLADIKRAAWKADQEAGLSDAEYLKRIKEGTPENTAAAELRKQIMDERANSKDEAERQRYMRAAQFFAKWGSTPGPTLAAGLAALDKTMPDIISDEQGYKKAKRELNKVIFDIDNATRLEELGNKKEARALKEKAADRAMQLNHYLAQAQSSENVAKIQQDSSKYTSDSNIRIAQLRENSAHLDRVAQRQTADDNKKYGQYQNARDQEILVNKRIAAEENGKQHMADVKLVNDAKIMKTADMPEGYAEKIAAAERRIQDREKTWTTEVEAAKKDTERAYSRVKVTTPAGGDTSAPAAPKTMSMADVEATAKAAGKTVEEVKEAAKKKGITIK